MSSAIARLTVIAIAVAGALLAWGAITLAGMELTLKESAPSESVGVFDVILATVVAGVAAWAVHALMLRLHWARFWPFAGSTALAISMTGPSWAADGETAMALMAMHFVAGIILIAGFAIVVPHGRMMDSTTPEQRPGVMNYLRREAG